MKRFFLPMIMMLLANVNSFADSNTSADLPELDYAIYINDTQATAGSQVTLSVKMKNASLITLWQTDIFLPESLTPATDESGNLIAKLSTARTTTAKHKLESNVVSSGAVRLFCASQGLKNFTGTDGEVATITLNVDKDLEPGTYTIQLKNTLIAQKDGTSFKPGTFAANLTVTSVAFTIGDVNNDGSITILDLASLISHLNGDTPADFNESAADIDQSGTITKADAIALAGMLTE